MRDCKTAVFLTHDGVELLYRHWPATQPGAGPRKAVVMFHRGHEHGGRMAHLPAELDLPDYDFSPGMPAATACHPARAATARASRPACAMCRPSSITSARCMPSSSPIWPCWPKAWVPC